LLTSGNFSAFHRIRQDEIWHFYAGSPVSIHCIAPDGTYMCRELGMDVEKGLEPQFTVPGRHWFASEVAGSDTYALVGCTVAPGFDFRDFELADRAGLAARYPWHTA